MLPVDDIKEVVKIENILVEQVDKVDSILKAFRTIVIVDL